jgi:metal transporter CNNM
MQAGLVLGLLSLDRMDLAVLKRAGSERQRWLVARVEPFSHNPHFTMCALVVVNAACNTALPLFIDRWVQGKGW